MNRFAPGVVSGRFNSIVTSLKGCLDMSASHRARSFSTAAVLAGVVACLSTARANAATIVSVSGTSISGWTFSNTSLDGGQNGAFTSTVGTLSGTWWALYANSSQTASQTYSFAGALAGVGQSALVPGDTVQIDVSLGFNNGGTVGIALQNSSGLNRFETYYIGNHVSDSFKLNDAGGQENITGPNTTFSASDWNGNPSNYQQILFRQLAGNAYSLSFNGTPVTNTGLTITASDITQVRFFNFNAGAGSDRNQYANNLVVVPEPTSLLVFAVGGLVWAVRALRPRG